MVVIMKIEKLTSDIDYMEQRLKNEIGDAKMERIEALVEEMPYKPSEEMIEPILTKMRETFPNVDITCRNHNAYNGAKNVYRFYLILEVKPEDVIDEFKYKRAAALREIDGWEDQMVKNVDDLKVEAENNICNELAQWKNKMAEAKGSLRE